jgi:hypothetical protein
VFEMGGGEVTLLQTYIRYLHKALLGRRDLQRGEPGKVQEPLLIFAWKFRQARRYVPARACAKINLYLPRPLRL